MSSWKRVHVEHIRGQLDLNNNNIPPVVTPPPLSKKPKYPTAKALYAEVLKRNLACVLGSGGFIPRPGPSSIPDSPTTSAALPVSSSPPPSPSLLSPPSPQFKVPAKQVPKKRKPSPSMDSIEPIDLSSSDEDTDSEDVEVVEDDAIEDHVKLSYSGDDEMDEEKEEKVTKKSTRKRGPAKRKYTKVNRNDLIS